METKIKTHYEGENKRTMSENDNQKDVNTELWKYYKMPKPLAMADGYDSFEISDDANTRWNAKTLTEEDAELIVTAVNACKTINPDNPLNVAKALPKLIDALHTFCDLRTAMWDDALNKAYRKGREALKQATE